MLCSLSFQRQRTFFITPLRISTMKTFTQILDTFNQALAQVSFGKQPKNLYEPIQYALSLGGKRMRPALMLMAYQLYKDDFETIMPTAIGIETFHNFTLLHDDVMDRADVRRGKPTVHKVWNDNTAILSGDNMLVMAFRFVAQARPEYLQQVVDLYTKTAIEIDEGQQYDIDFETRMDVREEEYIEMIRLKTSVLLACALKMGAIQAGAPDADADRLYRFGELLGLSFQLQDDLLDVYGDFRTFGKKIGGDILCNKKTFMLINALRAANPEQHRELEKWLDATEYDPEQKIAAVTALYDQIGVRQMAEQRINDYFAEAVKSLDAVEVAEENKRPLRDFAFALLQRKS